MSKFMTIREVARTKILPENALRQMVKTNDIPGFYVGNKFLINYDMLIKQLEEKSMEYLKIKEEQK